MLSVRGLIGATFAAFTISVASSASAATMPMAPGGVTAISVGNTYADLNSFGAFQPVDVTYTLTFTPVLDALSTIITINTNGGATNIGITNLFYEWVNVAGPVQVTDSLGNYIGSVATTITGLLSTSPLALHVYTGLNGGTLSGGGGYQVRITPSETPIPGAVVLFGSVLAVGVGGAKVMRRRRRAAIA